MQVARQPEEDRALDTHIQRLFSDSLDGHDYSTQAGGLRRFNSVLRSCFEEFNGLFLSIRTVLSSECSPLIEECTARVTIEMSLAV